MSIYPKEIIDFTYEVVHKKHKTKSSLIYKSSLIILFALLFSLPFILVDININSRGVINSKIDNYPIKSSITSNVSKILFNDDSFVKKGDTLLILNYEELIYKKNLLIKNTESKAAQIKDLRFILSGNISELECEKYIEEIKQYSDQLKLLEINKNSTYKNYRRQKKLFKSNVISTHEFENSKFKYDIALAELNNYESNCNKNWSAELEKYTSELNIAQVQLKNLDIEIERSIVISPVDGNINNYKSIEANSLVFANQQIAEISPTGPLIAEIYIEANDIGLLKKDMLVKLHIDAFNYNQWGLVNAKFTSISKDVIFMNSTPFFVAKCKLLEDKLVLKNGYEGKIKKGMGLSARIKITERSIYNLLYDKVDDWLNPNTKEV